jgi:hypothetical protein
MVKLTAFRLKFLLWAIGAVVLLIVFWVAKPRNAPPLNPLAQVSPTPTERPLLSTSGPVSVWSESGQAGSWKKPTVPFLGEVPGQATKIHSELPTARWEMRAFVQPTGRIIAIDYKAPGVVLRSETKVLEQRYENSGEKILAFGQAAVDQIAAKIMHELCVYVHPADVRYVSMVSVKLQHFFGAKDPDHPKTEDVILVTLHAKNAMPSGSARPDGDAARYLFKENGTLLLIDNTVGSL